MQAPPAPVAQKVVPSNTTPLRLGPKQLLVVGAQERVTIDPPGITVNAQIDTGAETSTLHAYNIVPFERDGESWVRFDFNPNDHEDNDADDRGQLITLERPISRKAKNRRRDGESSRRKVISIRVMLGDIDEEIDVTLINHSDFSHPLHLGRNLLIDNAIVDVSKNYIVK